MMGLLLAQDMAEVEGREPIFLGMVGTVIEVTPWTLILAFMSGMLAGAVVMRVARG